MKPLDPHLLRLVPESRAGILALAATGALQGFAAIAQAFAVAALVVGVVQGSDYQAVGVLLVAAFLVRGLAGGLTEWLAGRTGAQVSTALRAKLLAAALERDLVDRDGSARLLTLATQGATSIEPYVARYLPTLVNAVVLPPAAIIAMLILDWRTGLIPILTVPLLPLFAALIGASTKDATERRWATLAQLSGHFLDVMRGLPTLVAYGRGERQVGTIRRVSHAHRKATVATLRLAFLSSAALELLATISVAIVAVWTGIQLAQGGMELGLAMPLILLAPEAYWPIRRVGAEFHNAADGAEALARVGEELTRPSPEPTGEWQPGEPIQLRDVSYVYPTDERPALAPLDDVLPTPGLTLVTGPSGAGKTTLLEIIAGLRQPTTGRVVAPRAHLVTQRPFLTAGSLRENLLLSIPPERPAPTNAHLYKVLKEVGLADVVDALPLGLETSLGDDGFGLSAGQRARVALARAILAEPDALLLDEPTAHLDEAGVAEIEGLLARFSRACPVVLVSHRSDLADVADRHLHLEVTP